MMRMLKISGRQQPLLSLRLLGVRLGPFHKHQIKVRIRGGNGFG